MKLPILIGNMVMVAVTTLAQETHTAKITVRVVDESGKPVIGAPVATSVVDHYKPDEFGDAPVFRRLTVATDDHGVAVITAPSAYAEFDYSVMNFPGFYLDGGRFTFKQSIAGQWQPWNPTVELVLKAIGVQVPMYARRLFRVAIPAQGKPLGYDLTAGDWVAPYGKGETPDFIFQLDTKITNYLTLHFSNEGDGIQFVASIGGGLRLPRLAPSDGYQFTLTKWEWIEHGTNNRVPFLKEYSNYQKDANYFFRVRTKQDSTGKIVSALYGKIYGDFSEHIQEGNISFAYYLNPEPNSRNMEFDPNRNLFRNLGGFEISQW